MRILLKCPTRSRPTKVTNTIEAYVSLANRPDLLGIAVSCDLDDDTMARPLVKENLLRIMNRCEYKQIFYGQSKSKIEACNADMNNITYPWDIVVLVSDDMIPQVKGYDDAIRNYMLSKFPDRNGILWFNDGCQGDKLNTLCIFGRPIYESFGYIYHPSYKSLYCDTELTDLCKTTLKDKTLYIPYCIIRHEHPGTGYTQNMDELYQVNQRFWSTDMFNYIKRKAYSYDWSVLIPTMPGREQGLQRLMNSLYEKVGRIAPDLRMEICMDFDNRESSIGMKRQRLLERAKGKYLSFIDDDDEITDAYIEDLWACIQGNYHTMRIRGQMSQYQFVHSVDIKLTDMMATNDEIPYFQRPPNHLNPMLSDVAKLIPFKNAVHGEDLDWTINLYKHRFLSYEYQSDPSRIHYVYNLGTRVVQPETIKLQQTVSYETMLGLVFSPSGDAIAQQPQAPRQQGTTLKLGTRGFVISK